MYAVVFVLIISIIAIGYRSSSSSTTLANVVPGVSEEEDTSVDEVLATNVAASVAATTNLPVAQNVANLSVSVAAKNDVSQTDAITVSKPQIVQPQASRQEVITYKTVRGDTVQSVAKKYGISPTTVKWANNLTSDTLEAGKSLKILPVNGVLYTVQSGDTVDSIASDYGANKSRIVAFNNLEIDGIKRGQQLVIPSGELPEEERPGYVAPQPAVTTTYTATSGGTTSNASSNFLNASAGNRYAYGYCTWYVYERRAALGRPIGSFWGNANSWAYSSSAAGYAVGNTPKVGSILQTAYGGGGYGHAAVVESIDGAGNVYLSEMNYVGWNVISNRTIPAAQATSYNYIY